MWKAQAHMLVRPLSTPRAVLHVSVPGGDSNPESDTVAAAIAGTGAAGAIDAVTHPLLSMEPESSLWQ